MCAPPWAFPWDPRRGPHPEWLCKPYVEDGSASDSQISERWREKIYHLPHPCQPVRPGLEGENKEETITKVPLCLNHYILDLFVCTLAFSRFFGQNRVLSSFFEVHYMLQTYNKDRENIFRIKKTYLETKQAEMKKNNRWT